MRAKATISNDPIWVSNLSHNLQATRTPTFQALIAFIKNIMPAASDILQFMRGQLFQTPQLPKVDFTGKTVVVTGADSGLGFECAKHL